jgi:DHA2 family multidrug resistance protein
LVELSNPSTSQYQDTLKQMMDYFADHGSSLARAQQLAFAWIGQQVQVLAAYLAYIDVFWTLTVVSLAAPARAHTAQGEARRTGAGQPL